MNYLKISITLFLVLIGIAFINVALQALSNPQSLMNQVGISLNNPSALNSIRANYGGMNLIFGIFCIFAAFQMQNAALGLIALFTLGFVVGRFWSFYLDGSANEFVVSWLWIGAISFSISSLLLYLNGRPTFKLVAKPI